MSDYKTQLRSKAITDNDRVFMSGCEAWHCAVGQLALNTMLAKCVGLLSGGSLYLIKKKKRMAWGGYF